MSNTTTLIYSSDNFQIFSHLGGTAYEVTATRDGDPSVLLQGDSARELATDLDGFEQQAGTDKRFAADVDHYLSQYFD